MSDNAERERSLEERIQRLESAVVELQRLVRQLQSALLENEVNVLDHDLPQPAELTSSATPQTSTATLSSPAPVASAKPPTNLDWLQNWEFWLNRLGIGLLLLGVGFLFKFSVDQGWLTPTVRVLFGVALGLTLLVTGQRLATTRWAFSQILMGGAIAVWYLSGFASFQLFNLVPYGVAFAWMLGVTGLTFFLSLRQNQAVLSVLGAVGGLGTPFLLYTGSGSMVGLIGYTCLLLLGTAAIYFWQGWRSLLWTSFGGGWLIMLLALLSLLGTRGGVERWAVQGGILFSGLMFASLPILRQVGQRRMTRSLPGLVPDPDSSAELISVVTPVLVLALSRQLWSLPDSTWGWLAILGAVIYGGLGYGLRRFWPSLAEIETLVCFLLLAIALVLSLSGNLLFLMLGLEAVILHLLAARWGDRKILVAAHLLSATISLRLFELLLTENAVLPAVFNPAALTYGLVIVILAGLGVRLMPTPGWIYLGIAHIAALIWLSRELSLLSSGFVTISWGLYAIALLVFGLRRDHPLLRGAGLGTLALVIIKLFFFDLIGLEAIWRILLFMGFGAGLLLLSYSFRSLWKPQSSPPPSSLAPEPERSDPP